MCIGVYCMYMDTLSRFFSAIYLWMAVGVGVSAFFAYITTFTPLLGVVYSSSFYVYGLFGIQLALVFFIQFMIHKLSATVSLLLYFLYAALNGVTIAGLILYHIATSSPLFVITIFVSALLMFVFLAVYGYYSKIDYSPWGKFLFAGVIGVLIASISNILIQSSVFHIIIASVALLVFAALTVYDNQFYKNIYASLDTPEEKHKMVILGALHMYINLIVIFQSLLTLLNNNE